jgi:predicted nucleic acid-binding protein
MTVDSFLDTNILVYAAAGSGAEMSKRKRALELIENNSGQPRIPATCLW